MSNLTTTPNGRIGTVRADEVVVGEMLTSTQGVLFPARVLEAHKGIDMDFCRVVEFRLEGHRDTIVFRASQTVFVEPSATAH